MWDVETFDRMLLQTIGLLAALFGVGLLFNAVMTSTTWAEVLWSGMGGVLLLALSLFLYRHTRGLPMSRPNGPDDH